MYAKQRIDGLDANKMNQNFVGIQKQMRNTTIKDATYLVAYSPILIVGDAQSMIFHLTHPEPCKMAPAEINNRARKDKVLVGAVGKERDKTVPQLIKSIQEQTGVPVGKFNNKSDFLQATRARMLGLSTRHVFAHSNI